MEKASIPSLNEPIALGRTAEIYAWEKNQILKLFQGWISMDNVLREARICRGAWAAGLPVPAVGEVVEVNGRFGLIYERVEGPTMERVLRKVWSVFRCARLMARLQADIHAAHLGIELPSQRQRLRRRIQEAEALSPELQKAALAALDQLPDGDQVCHGDFHPTNILIAARGPVVIDWNDAAYGNPLADIARTLVIVSPRASYKTLYMNLFAQIYQRAYFQSRPEERAQLAAWRPVIAAARLWDKIPGERDWLLACVRSNLAGTCSHQWN